MKNEKNIINDSDELDKKDSNEMFQIVDGVKTDRFIFAEELTQEDDDLSMQIYRKRQRINALRGK